MTTLRDDGYLETDDPPVVACFLDKWGVIVTSEGGSRMTVELDGVTTDQTYSHGIPSSYPIRVSAALVAEVWDDDLRIGPVLEGYGNFSVSNLGDWKRKHTEEA